LIYYLIKTFPLFFTGCNLRPPGIGIEATAALVQRQIITDSQHNTL